MRALLLVLLIALALPASLHAAENTGGYSALTEARTPLVIIRYNQRNVYYDHALQNAVSKAVEAKRDVIFDVILRPGAGNSGDARLGKIVGSLNDIGVPSSQIAATTGPRSDSRFDEVYIFVR